MSTVAGVLKRTVVQSDKLFSAECSKEKVITCSEVSYCMSVQAVVVHL